MNRWRTLILLFVVLGAILPTLHAQEPKIPTEKFLEEGRKAFDKQQWALALEFYTAALTQDSRNEAALESAGYCQLMLGRAHQAAANLERACKLSPHDRCTVHNLAVSLYLTNSGPRAIRMLMDYLNDHPSPADEQIFNSLQYMIAKADDSTRRAAIHGEAMSFAKAFEEQLNTLRPDAARWGYLWYEKATIRELQATERKAKSQIDDANRRVTRLERDIQEASQRITQIEQRVTRGLDTADKLVTSRVKLKDLLTERDQALAEQASVQSTLGRPLIERLPVLQPGAGVPALAPISALPTTQPTTQPVPAVPQRGPVPTPPPTTQALDTSYINGVAVTSDLIVTTASSLKGASDIVIHAPGDFTCMATVSRMDLDNDLALLRLKGKTVRPIQLAKQIAPGAFTCVLYPSTHVFDLKTKEYDGSCATPGATWTVKIRILPSSAGAALIANRELIGLATRGDDPSAVPAIPVTFIRRLAGTDLDAVKEFAADPTSAVVQIEIRRPK